MWIVFSPQFVDARRSHETLAHPILFGREQYGHSACRLRGESCTPLAAELLLTLASARREPDQPERWTAALTIPSLSNVPSANGFPFGPHIELGDDR